MRYVQAVDPDNRITLAAEPGQLCRGKDTPLVTWWWAYLLFWLLAVPVAAQQSDGSLSGVMDLIRAQKTELAAQRDIIEQQQRQLAEQQESINVLRKEIDAMQKIAAPMVASPGNSQSVPTPVEKTATDMSLAAAAGPADAAAAAEHNKPAVESGLPTEKETYQADTLKFKSIQRDDPTKILLAEFPGAMQIPGSNTLVRIGGFVKTSLVNNFEPLASKDRFIVGDIPVAQVEQQGLEAEANISTSQSRLNFDLREPTDVGMMRAFVEGDFEGSGNTFRLRHAFGSWKGVLAGQTWTNFMDTDASPEEIDFEGLNGRINVRQPQLRLTPILGEGYGFNFSLEDPNPSVQGGVGVTEVPDIVGSARFGNDQRHVRLAGILRQVRAQIDNGSNIEAERGYGISVSGSLGRPRLDARNKILWQLNAGRGIGRYVNDLSTIGDYDGVFDPATGDLVLFDVYSGYVSGQFWWGDTLRTNLTFGYVEIDNPEFVDLDAYRETFRSSINLIWSPMPRITLGGELLWGTRENQDGESGDAAQAQFAATYNF